MRNLILSVMLVLMTTACIMGVDYFVRTAAAGDGSGSSYANAMSIATAFEPAGYDYLAGDRIIFAPGTYDAGAASLDLGSWQQTTDGSDYVYFIADRSGYWISALDSAVNAGDITPGDVIIDGSNIVDQNGIIKFSNWTDFVIDGFIIRNGPIDSGEGYGCQGIRISGTTDNVIIRNTVVHSMTGGGIIFYDGPTNVLIKNCLVYNIGFMTTDGLGTVGAGGINVDDGDNVEILNCTAVMTVNRAIRLYGCTNSVVKNSVAFNPDSGTLPDNTYQKAVQLQDKSGTGAVGITVGAVHSLGYQNQQFSIAPNPVPAPGSEVYYWGIDANNDGSYDAGEEVVDVMEGNLYFNNIDVDDDDNEGHPFNRDLYDVDTPAAGVNFYTFEIGSDEFFSVANFTEDDFRLSLGAFSTDSDPDASPVNGGKGTARKLALDALTTFADDTILDGDTGDLCTNNNLPTYHTDQTIVNCGYHWVPDNDSNGYSDADADLDGIPDSYETTWSVVLDTQDPTDASEDPDGDGYTNLQEYTQNTTNGPNVYDQPDVDGDGLDDRWEQYYSPDRDGDDATITAAELDDFSDSSADYDNDGMTDVEEEAQATDTGNPDPYDPVSDTGTDVDPTVADTDADGIDDGIEDGLGTYDSNTTFTGSSPINADSDGDLLPDGWEVGIGGVYGGPWGGANGIPGDGADEYLDPNDGSTAIHSSGDFDSDGDSNALELSNGTDPTDPNSKFTDIDDDGIDDNWELAQTGITLISQLGTDNSFLGSETDVADNDSDGLTDYEEYVLYVAGTLVDPIDADTDDDWATDGAENTAGTDPTNNDTDGDNLWDGWEITYDDGSGWDPLVSDDANGTYSSDQDPDSDTLSNQIESTLNTNPNSTDTDGDGYTDDWEYANGYDPTNGASKPASKSGSGGGGCLPGTGSGLALLALAGLLMRKRG